MNPWAVAFLVLAVCFLIACSMMFGPAIKRWLSGRYERHSLWSEVHGLLEMNVKQTAAIVEIRDLLRAGSIADDRRGDRALSVLEECRTAEAVRANEQEKVVALLGQIRDFYERADTGPSDLDGRLFKQGEDQLAKLQHIVELLSFANGPLASLDKQSSEQLGALKKLDDRLFEFIASTKRITKALEGDTGEDEDELIDQAKMIRAKAVDRGIEISFEDAYKRAKELRIYNRG